MSIGIRAFTIGYDMYVSTHFAQDAEHEKYFLFLTLVILSFRICSRPVSTLFV